MKINFSSYVIISHFKNIFHYTILINVIYNVIKNNMEDFKIYVKKLILPIFTYIILNVFDNSCNICNFKVTSKNGTRT